MKAEACAMHIVYMEDLEGSVQRIFDYILSSPDVYHQGYHQGLVDQVNRLASYVHDKEESTGPMVGNMPRDFDCSSSSQRMLQSMQKQHVRQQLFDSMETCLGEPMARVNAKDSSFYIKQDYFDPNRIFNILLTTRMAVGRKRELTDCSFLLTPMPLCPRSHEDCLNWP